MPPQERTSMSPRHIDHTAPACLAVREVLNRVGDKWSIYIVGYLRDGLVTRTVFPTIPPRVDYELTDLGRTLLEPVLAISQWAERHRDEIQASRLRFDIGRDGQDAAA